MDPSLCPLLSECVLQLWVLCMQGGSGCYFLPSGRDFHAVDICTNASSCLHPIMGEKLPPTTKKNPALRLHSLKSPEEEKVSRKKKKSPLSPTNTSWSPGQSWMCTGLPDNWALSRQKPMLHSADRNSVNPQALILTPPLACLSHMAPNNQVTALIVTIIQHLHSD